MSDDEPDEIETIADGRVEGGFVRTFWFWNSVRPDLVIAQAQIRGEQIEQRFETDEWLDWLSGQPDTLKVPVGDHEVEMPHKYLDVMAGQIKILRD